MDLQPPFSPDIMKKILGAHVLLDIVAFENPQYHQMINLVRAGHVFFIDYSTQEKFFVYPVSIAHEAGIADPDSRAISESDLNGGLRRNILNELNKDRSGFWITIGRGTKKEIIAGIASAEFMRQVMREFYVSPESPGVQEHLRIPDRKYFSREHNKKILKALLADTPEGPNKAGGP
jgi:hypothetical protein